MIYFFVTGLVLLLWAPVLGYFLRMWFRRKNPISLAICAIVLLVLHSGLMRPFERGADPDVVLWTMLSANVVVALYFYGACWWARKNFKGDRQDDAQSG